PTLLEELGADESTLARRLDPTATGTAEPCVPPDEMAFRYDMNADAMATEKLAEGIRNFVADQVKLEELISTR
ncbi:MAG: transaldolase, partial [Halioglobus sp.]|nr:transaldolase [Halioglobus sp.]